MQDCKRCWLVLAVIALGVGSGPDFHPRRTRAKTLHAIPDYGYQHLSYSQPATAKSMPAIGILAEQRQPFTLGRLPGTVSTEQRRAMTPPVSREQVRYFQFPQRELRVDHCSISRVALVLHENAFWTLSLRADQNPWFRGGTRNVLTPVPRNVPVSGLVSNGLKRNQFVVRIRCLGAAPLGLTRTDVGPPKPVLLELGPCVFWVQRGQPYSFWRRVAHPDLAKVFDLIDQVEIEFVYR